MATCQNLLPTADVYPTSLLLVSCGVSMVHSTLILVGRKPDIPDRRVHACAIEPCGCNAYIHSLSITPWDSCRITQSYPGPPRDLMSWKLGPEAYQVSNNMANGDTFLIGKE